MSRFILSISLAIYTLLASISVSAQKIPMSVVPDLVKEMQKMCPEKVDEAMTMTNIFLENSTSCLVFEFMIDETVYGLTSTDLITEFNHMSEKEKKEYLGEEFSEIEEMLPIPIVASMKFKDGKEYKMKLSN